MRNWTLVRTVMELLLPIISVVTGGGLSITTYQNSKPLNS